jgi:predicted dehydrogenase
LSDRPVHVESYFSYDLGDKSYVGAFLGNRQHWVRQLPGQLLHNIISHGIARLAEFLDDELTQIVATADQSESLRTSGGEEVLDELRVLIRDKRGTTAFFCFSTQIRGLNELRVYSTAGSIVVDVASGSLIRNKRRGYKSYLTYFVPPLKNAGQQLRNAGVNLTNFVRKRLYQDAGMKELIKRFYNCIRLDTDPPIPYREIILTAVIMDEIFAQIYPTDVRSSTMRAADATFTTFPLQSTVK